jgi:acyl transferase domain-containing protein
MDEVAENLTGLEIAVVGMAGQFPGAVDIAEFWQLLRSGTEGITHFSAAQLQLAGVTATRLAEEGYVLSKGVLTGCYLFDHQFFGYSAREAELMDPQLRKFHQLAYWTLDDAGYANQTEKQRIGVFGGAGNNPFWLAANLPVMGADFARNYEISSLNGREFLATRSAYKLGLRGPAITVQTACSTSLVAVHLACQSLLAGECELALAGGVAIYSGADIALADQSGYQYQHGMILSPDGHCRPFDQDAAGTVPADGMGMLALKRLDDALADGDGIYAVLRATAVNNDGHDKAGYTAPSVRGQVDVLQQALQASGLRPQDIGYVEAHGTGTRLGDPIEIQALSQVYQQVAAPIWLGSVKSNIGHLDAAAGMAGLIKAILMVQQGEIPASLHFKQWNSEIAELASFVVPTQSMAWTQAIRTAAVSSFGIGGTNAHAIVQSAPKQRPEYRREQACAELLVWSAKSAQSLEAYQSKLLNFCQHADLTDTAYTLACRKQHLQYRRAMVLSRNTPLSENWQPAAGQLVSGKAIGHEQLVFVFPGQGSDYPSMATALYRDNTVFKSQLDLCLSELSHCSTIDFRYYLFTQTERTEPLSTNVAQPLIFAFEYALTQALLALGIRPDVMIGHSLGEYVCAVQSGMLSLSSALRLVVRRADLMQHTDEGVMLAVSLSAEALMAVLPEDVDIAAVNASDAVVVAGSIAAVAVLAAILTEQGVSYKYLTTTRAFHSRLMTPVLSTFAETLKDIVWQPPQGCWISTVTGQQIDQQVCSADYWCQQIRQPVLFAGSVNQLLDKKTLFIEVGPGQALSQMIRQHPRFDASKHQVCPLVQQQDLGCADAALLVCAKLFVAGATPKWPQRYQPAQAKFLHTPSYVFAEHEFRPVTGGLSPMVSEQTTVESLPVQAQQLQWQDVSLTLSRSSWPIGTVLIFSDGCSGLAGGLEHLLAQAGHRVLVIEPGEAFTKKSPRYFRMSALKPEHWQQLKQQLIIEQPTRIIDLWPLSSPDVGAGARRCLLMAHHLLADYPTLCWHLVGRQLYSLTGGSQIDPDTAYLYPAMRVLGQEISGLCSNLLDIGADSGLTADSLLSILQSVTEQPLLLKAGRKLWQPVFQTVQLSQQGAASVIRQGGCYLITGGTSGIGLALAIYLAETYQVQLILLSRQAGDPVFLAGLKADPQFGRIQASAASVHFYGCDIADSEQCQHLALWLQTEFPQLNGVFHAAGEAGQGLHQGKTVNDLDKVLAAKVAGSQHLIAMLAQMPQSVDFLLLFSSITSWLGGVGQYDYSIANQYLDKLAAGAAQRYPVLSLNWDTWRDVGIMANSQRVYRHPMSWLTAMPDVQPGQQLFQGKLEVHKIWALQEHLVYGVPTLPGATYLSLAVAYLWRSSLRVFIPEASFLQPLVLNQGQACLLQLSATQDVNSSLDPSLHFEVSSRTSDGRTLTHCRGMLATATAEQSEPVHLADLQQRAQQVYRADGDTSWQQLLVATAAGDDALDGIQFGARWQVLKSLYLWQGHGLAELQLGSAFTADLEGLALHPALLDCATAFMRVVGQSEVYLPLMYRDMVLYRPLPAHFWSWCEVLPTEDAGTLSYRVRFCDPQGQLLAEIGQFVMRRVDAQRLPDNLAQYPWEKIMAEAINSTEAWPWLELALQQPLLSDVIISRKDISKLLRDDELSVVQLAVTPAQKRFARPDLPVAFKAARTEPERQIAEYLAGLLGLEQVGTDDGFFDLGGNSLQLTQLHQFLSSTLGLKIDVASLFQHNSVTAILRLQSPDTQTEHRLDQAMSRAERQLQARQSLRQRKQPAGVTHD